MHVHIPQQSHCDCKKKYSIEILILVIKRFHASQKVYCFLELYYFKAKKHDFCTF